MIEIEVCERLMDYWYDADGKEKPMYHAQVKDKPGLWGCGKYRVNAIGDLISSHPEVFGIKITCLEGKLPR